MAAPRSFPAEIQPAQAAPAGAAGPASGSPTELRNEYQHLGRQLRRWVVGGAALLLALPLLWWLLPNERRLVPTPAAGYRWRQAGTVRDSGTTWVWALADSAGQAQLLLSRTQGRTWTMHRLGVKSAQAQALALGWGSPWRGVLVGQQGELRVLPNVLRLPQQGTNLKSPATVGITLGVDTSGQQLVVADSVGLWHSLDAGRTWKQWKPSSPANPAQYDRSSGHLKQVSPPYVGITQVLFEPAGRRFFAVSQRGILLQSRDASQEWEAWAELPASTAPVIYAGFVRGRILLVYQHGIGLLISGENQPSGSWVLGKYRVFTNSSSRPVALVRWRTEKNDTAVLADTTPLQQHLLGDSMLLFEAATKDGRLQRTRLLTQAITAPDQLPLQQSPTAPQATD